MEELGSMTLMRSEMLTPRRLWTLGLLCLLAITGGLAAAPPASAGTCTDIALFDTPPANAPLPGSCFEGWDGDQVDSDAPAPGDPEPAAPNRLDWGSTQVLSSSQKALDYVQGAADSQFTQGTEENPDSWKWNVGSLGSEKYDMISGYSYQEPNTQDLMLSLAFVRKSNNGTSWLAFELNQKQPGYRSEPLVNAIPPKTLAVPTRSSGDLLITYSVSNNNNPKPIIGLCKWVGDEHSGVWTNMSGVPVASNCPALSAKVAQADMNGDDIQAADNYLGSPAGKLIAGTFGEASINLSEAFKAAGADPDTEDDCLSFGYMWAHSRSSEPVTSAQQDFILPTDAISAANCAVEGTKWHDKNGNGLLDGTDEELSGWTIYADYDNDGVRDAGEPSDVTAPKDANDLRPKGTYSLTNLADGTYPIREVAQSGWNCTSPSPFDTDAGAPTPLAASLCGTEVEMDGDVISGVDFLNFQVLPGIELTKTNVLNSPAAPEAGDTITYTFDIENTGNVALSGVDLDDDKLGYANVLCTTATLAVGASTSCTGNYTLTQADIDAGSVHNDADACGDPAGGGAEVCSPDDTTTTLPADPEILLEKTAVLVAAGAVPVAGDKVTYTFEITNTGNVTLDGVDLDDDLLGLTNVVCNAVSTLAPDASTTCTQDYTLTQTDIDAGEVDNDADACGDSPADVEVCSPDDTSTPLAADPKIELEKTAVLNTAAGVAPKAGDTVTYTFKITNKGNVTLDGVDLDDDLLGLTNVVCNAVSVLAPKASTTCTQNYTLTQADINAGKVDNDADACGDSPADVEVCSPDDTSTPLTPDKQILLEKTAVLNTAAGVAPKAGDTITYTFKITNKGNVTLTGVDLDDDLLGYTDVVCNLVTTLLPNGSTTCTGTYVLTQADVDAGEVDNQADACGDPPVGPEVCSPDSTTTPLPKDPDIDLVKTGVLNTAAGVAPKAGDTITYTFKITNTGNVTLNGVDLDDDLLKLSGIVCEKGQLAPAESATCTKPYTLTQADIDAGSVKNKAEACGDGGHDTTVCAPDDTTTPLPADPKISLDKSAVLNAGTPVKAGDTITYTFKITNAGNVTLDGVDLDDALVGLTDAVCNGVTVLAPGASTTCTKTYTLKQADIDAGKVDNSAKACGDSPKDVEVCSTDTTSTPLPAAPKIDLQKDATLNTGGDGLQAGDTVTYKFTIKNVGNVTLTGVDLDDALLGLDSVVCNAITTLAPGETTICTKDHKLTQADVDAGKVDNVADACGDSPAKVEVCDEDDTTTPLDPEKAIQLKKTAVLNAPAAPKAGDTITYTFEITNIGNVTLTGVDLDDALVGKDNATCGDATLSPDEVTSCTADHTLTQADIDKGSVTNVADVCGDSPAPVTEVCDDDTTTTPLSPSPSIDLKKTAVLKSAGAPKAGEKITYSFEITNAGNVTLDGVDLDDALVGFDNATCDKTELAPGAKTSCSVDYTLTQGDIDKGKVDNLAKACGDSPKDVEVCDDDGTSTPLPADPKIDLKKTAALSTPVNPKAGDKIAYGFEITNTGNVTLTGSDLDDALVGFANAACGAATLAPGAKATCTADYTLTQDDVDAGTVTNTAKACADPPAGDEVCDEDTTTTPLDPSKGIQVDKDGPATVYHGDQATYTFLVTNTGNASLSDVKVSDDKCADVKGIEYVKGDADSKLEPGEQWKYTCTKTVGAHADGEANPVVNTVTATGKDPKGATHTDTDTHETKVLHAAVQIDKTGPGGAEAGSRVQYALVVTNPGDTALVGEKVGVTDPKCESMPALSAKKRGAGDDPTPNTLDPGDSWVYTCTVQTKVGEQSVVNVASVAADDVNGRRVNDDDDFTTPLTQPQIQVLPEVVVSGAAKLRGPSKCVDKPFVSRVTGKRIKSVSWYVDGKKVKTFTSKTGEATRANYRVRPDRYGKGVHRLKARVVFADAARTPARTLRMTFQQCAKQVIAPKFTG